MATNFPSSLDNSTTLPAESANIPLSTNHVIAHQNIQDALEAVEAKIGVDSSAVATSLDYKVTNTSSSNPGHKHTLANGATDVTSSASELNILDGATLTVTELNYVDGVTSAIQTQLNDRALDSAVVHDTGNETIDGVKTFTSDPLIPDEAYGGGWDGVLEPPTKNAVYDKIQTLDINLTPNTQETSNTWYTWTQPFIATAVPVMLGFTNNFTVSSNDYGGFGHKTLSASAGVVLYDKLSGNGSNETYTAASSKDIKFKWRMTQNVSGSGDYLGFGIADATTTFDDIQSSTAAGVRFVNNNGVIYASNGNGSSNTNTNVDTGITDANWNVYEIVFNPGTDAKFYINGTLVATHTTNLPTGSLQLFGIGYTKGTNNITFYINPVTISLEM